MFNNLKWFWFKRKLNKKYSGSLSDDYQGRLTQIVALFEDRDTFLEELPYKYVDKTLQMYCQNLSFREPVRSLSKSIIEEAITAMMLEVSDPRETMKHLWKAYEIVGYTHNDGWYFLTCLDKKTAISPYFPTYETLRAELKFISSMCEENIFKCSNIRRLADYLIYAKIMVNVLANEDILAIYEETYNEYRKGN